MTLIVIMVALAFDVEGSFSDTNDASTVLPGAVARPARDLASEVQALFGLKCAECHRAHMPRPKGKIRSMPNFKQVGLFRPAVVPLPLLPAAIKRLPDSWE